MSEHKRHNTQCYAHNLYRTEWRAHEKREEEKPQAEWEAAKKKMSFIYFRISLYFLAHSLILLPLLLSLLYIFPDSSHPEWDITFIQLLFIPILPFEVNVNENGARSMPMIFYDVFRRQQYETYYNTA